MVSFIVRDDGISLRDGDDANEETESQSLEAALCFFRALKVYPNAEELFQIYDKTVPKVCFRWYKILMNQFANISLAHP
jgi:hypothetical protein